MGEYYDYPRTPLQNLDSFNDTYGDMVRNSRQNNYSQNNLSSNSVPVNKPLTLLDFNRIEDRPKNYEPRKFRQVFTQENGGKRRKRTTQRRRKRKGCKSKRRRRM
uniref:Uncharacterized protein n=1 Tax=viral metagenome TaxID=1070528 RepID=A0A6C0DG45_9ZZZZ